MLEQSSDQHNADYQMNERGYTRSNQIDILYVQSGTIRSSTQTIRVKYNPPVEGTPKSLQPCINFGFMETGISVLL